MGEGRVFSSEGMSELFFFLVRMVLTAKRRKDEGLPENGQYMRKGAEALKARVCEGLLVVWRGRSTRRQGVSDGRFAAAVGRAPCAPGEQTDLFIKSHYF